MAAAKRDNRDMSPEEQEEFDNLQRELEKRETENQDLGTGGQPEAGQRERHPLNSTHKGQLRQSGRGQQKLQACAAALIFLRMNISGMAPVLRQ